LIRKNLGLPTDRRIVLHVGHIKSNRNLSDLAGFASLEEYLPVLVGSTSTMKEQEVEEGLRGKGVRVVSEYVGRIEEYYQAADLYLFPVKDPTAAIDFPLSVLEAISAGIPVLMRPFGALRDAFPQGIGIEYYRDEGEIAAKASMLLKQDPREVVENHRKRIKGFSWDEIAQRLVSLASGEL
jgi:glycosyltransferase involved in cell wall biosynthesis